MALDFQEIIKVLFAPWSYSSERGIKKQDVGGHPAGMTMPKAACRAMV